MNKKCLYFLSLLLIMICPSLSKAASYTYQYLDVPDGWVSSKGYGINDSGDIAGFGGAGGGQGTRALYWDGFDFTTLHPDGWQKSQAYAINESGVVVGYGQDGEGDYTAFTWENNEFTIITDVGWSSTKAVGITDGGVVIGYGRNGYGNRAFSWDGTDLVDLGTPGGLSPDGPIEILGVNNDNETVGFGYNPTQARLEAFFWDIDGDYISLNPGGWTGVYARAINDNGLVVGDGRDGAGRELFLWDGVDYTALGLPSGWTSANAAGINDDGYIVGDGTSETGKEHAFIWNGTDFIDLNPENWVSSHALDINQFGEIVGWGKNEEGKLRAFIAIPVPEPASFLLTATGLLSLLGFKKRK